MEVDPLTRDSVTSGYVYRDRRCCERIRREGEAKVTEANALAAVSAGYVKDIAGWVLLSKFCLAGNSSDYYAYGGR